MDTTDVLIHLKKDIPADGRRQIEESLQGCDGMISGHFIKDHPQLVKVVYDPAAISSWTILKHVQDQGVEASLIGC
ncbi:MAG: hypothetical protein QGH73_11470 [Rhodospirillales bacterium]|nr:hypothetical protein [Rhodospirillales bacterium]MDP6842288.1 hypothetical protein [Rhodospirillales bacterium]